MVVVHAATGLFCSADSGRRCTATTWGWLLWFHAHLESADVLAADRGFCSFAHLALLPRRGAAAMLTRQFGSVVQAIPEDCWIGEEAGDTIFRTTYRGTMS